MYCLHRECNGSTIYGKNFIALYKTMHKIKKLEKESPHVGKTERPQEEEEEEGESQRHA